MEHASGSIHAKKPGIWHAWLDLPPRRRVYLGQFATCDAAFAAFKHVTSQPMTADHNPEAADQPKAA
jgi:hypothetical protein